MSKSNVSFREINKAVGEVLNATREPYLKTTIDGIYHVFQTKRDYIIFNEDRNLELIDSKS